MSRNFKVLVAWFGIAIIIGALFGLIMVFAPKDNHQGIMSFGNPAIVESDTMTEDDTAYALAQMESNLGAKPIHKQVYNYSLIPGGVSTVDEFRIKVGSSALLAKYFSGCYWDTAKIGYNTLSSERMTYLKDGKIFWTRKTVKIGPAGTETLMSIQCGRDIRVFLLRCGNEISSYPVPNAPTGKLPPVVLEKPVPYFEEPEWPTPEQPFVPNPPTDPIITATVYENWCCFVPIGGVIVTSRNPTSTPEPPMSEFFIVLGSLSIIVGIIILAVKNHKKTDSPETKEEGRWNQANWS